MTQANVTLKSHFIAHRYSIVKIMPCAKEVGDWLNTTSQQFKTNETAIAALNGTVDMALTDR